jgi:hypothetical protein
MINQQFTIPFQSNYCAQAVNALGKLGLEGYFGVKALAPDV